MQKIYILKEKEAQKHKFYTTISALCEAHTREDIGVSQSTLQKFNFDKANYENDTHSVERVLLKKRSDVLKEKEQQNQANAAQFIWISNIEEYPKYCARIFGVRDVAKELGGAIFYDNCDEWLVAVQQDEVLGFSGYDKSGETFTFKRAYVFKPYRRFGIYREMFNQRYSRAKELGCKILQAKTTIMSRQMFIDNGFQTQTNLPKKFVVYRKMI